MGSDRIGGGPGRGDTWKMQIDLEQFNPLGARGGGEKCVRLERVREEETPDV